jgi:hypothetical protein
MPTDKELRASGYLTIDEWVDDLTEITRRYLKESVWPNVSPKELMHPEDLLANSSQVADVLLHALPVLGARRK